MSELMLFIDSSANPQAQLGYGAYLALTEPGLPLEELRSQVKVRRFKQTSSTKLELQTLLWALGEIQPAGQELRVYTDSQNIIGLPRRRERLERRGYRSSNNRPINNEALYREFYRLTDLLACRFVQVQGHQLSKQKDDIDRLFTLVDRASRSALRSELR